MEYKFTCFYTNSDTRRDFDTFEEAVEAAESYCGNDSYAQPFPGEPYTRLYGPGDGTTSVMVRMLRVR